MSLFDFKMNSVSVDEITIYFFYSNWYNPADYLLNLRAGCNHLLVISSAFGLLSARSGVWSITTI
jgi:hypothetical protein